MPAATTPSAPPKGRFLSVLAPAWVTQLNFALKPSLTGAVFFSAIPASGEEAR